MAIKADSCVICLTSTLSRHTDAHVQPEKKTRGKGQLADALFICVWRINPASEQYCIYYSISKATLEVTGTENALN